MSTSHLLQAVHLVRAENQIVLDELIRCVDHSVEYNNPASDAVTSGVFLRAYSMRYWCQLGNLPTPHSALRTNSSGRMVWALVPGTSMLRMQQFQMVAPCEATLTIYRSRGL